MDAANSAFCLLLEHGRVCVWAPANDFIWMLIMTPFGCRQSERLVSQPKAMCQTALSPKSLPCAGAFFWKASKKMRHPLQLQHGAMVKQEAECPRTVAGGSVSQLAGSNSSWALYTSSSSSPNYHYRYADDSAIRAKKARLKK